MRFLRFFFLFLFSFVWLGLAFAGDSVTITSTGSRYSRLSYAADHPRGRHDLSIIVQEMGFIGWTNRENLFFDVPAGDITNSMLGARIGLEGVAQHMGIKLLAGYQRLFYSSIGIEESNKNLIAFDILGTYSFRETPRRFDPYVIGGVSILVSGIDQQAYVNAGVGSRFFLSDNWSLSLEAIGMTELEGYWGGLTFGWAYHF
jgi:hypothetical protein